MKEAYGDMDDDDGLGPPKPRKRPQRRGPSRAWEQPFFTGDPVIDAWEREIAAGRTPNLEATPARGSRRR